jgi:hypothetical protein
MEEAKEPPGSGSATEMRAGDDQGGFSVDRELQELVVAGIATSPNGMCRTSTASHRNDHCDHDQPRRDRKRDPHTVSNIELQTTDIPSPEPSNEYFARLGKSQTQGVFGFTNKSVVLFSFEIATVLLYRLKRFF